MPPPFDELYPPRSRGGGNPNTTQAGSSVQNSLNASRRTRQALGGEPPVLPQGQQFAERFTRGNTALGTLSRMPDTGEFYSPWERAWDMLPSIPGSDEATSIWNAPAWNEAVMQAQPNWRHVAPPAGRWGSMPAEGVGRPMPPLTQAQQLAQQFRRGSAAPPRAEVSINQEEAARQLLQDAEATRAYGLSMPSPLDPELMQRQALAIGAYTLPEAPSLDPGTMREQAASAGAYGLSSGVSGAAQVNPMLGLPSGVSGAAQAAPPVRRREIPPVDRETSTRQLLSAGRDVLSALGSIQLPGVRAYLDDAAANVYRSIEPSAMEALIPEAAPSELGIRGRIRAAAQANRLTPPATPEDRRILERLNQSRRAADRAPLTELTTREWEMHQLAERARREEQRQAGALTVPELGIPSGVSVAAPAAVPPGVIPSGVSGAAQASPVLGAPSGVAVTAPQAVVPADGAPTGLAGVSGAAQAASGFVLPAEVSGAAQAVIPADRAPVEVTETVPAAASAAEAPLDYINQARRAQGLSPLPQTGQQAAAPTPEMPPQRTMPVLVPGTPSLVQVPTPPGAASQTEGVYAPVPMQGFPTGPIGDQGPATGAYYGGTMYTPTGGAVRYPSAALPGAATDPYAAGIARARPPSYYLRGQPGIMADYAAPQGPAYGGRGMRVASPEQIARARMPSPPEPGTGAWYASLPPGQAEILSQMRRVQAAERGAYGTRLQEVQRPDGSVERVRVPAGLEEARATLAGLTGATQAQAPINVAAIEAEPGRAFGEASAAERTAAIQARGGIAQARIRAQAQLQRQMLAAEQAYTLARINNDAEGMRTAIEAQAEIRAAMLGQTPATTRWGVAALPQYEVTGGEGALDPRTSARIGTVPWVYQMETAPGTRPEGYYGPALAPLLPQPTRAEDEEERE